MAPAVNASAQANNAQSSAPPAAGLLRNTLSMGQTQSTLGTTPIATATGNNGPIQNSAGTINIKGAPDLDHIYIGNVRPTHNADQIVSVIHIHANIEKEQIDIADLSRNQSHPRTKAFKVSVPKGKLHTVTQLPWDSAIKIQAFR